jgi:hypothetical protein
LILKILLCGVKNVKKAFKIAVFTADGLGCFLPEK